MADQVGMPAVVSFGEALTDMIRSGPEQWVSICGGAPWNLARALAGLGVPTAFGGAISADVFGQAIWVASQAAGLDMRFTQQLPGRSPLLAIVHETSPPQYFFVGDDSADLHFDAEALPAGWTEALQWAHFGGISLTREPLAARLLGLAESLKHKGKRISYDPNFRAMAMDASYDTTLERMCRIADVIKVWDEDLCGLFRCADPGLGLAQISEWNPHALLLLTRGADGASLFQPQLQVHARPPLIEVKDTVGAGDAAMAGLLFSLMRAPAAEAQQHLRWAVAAGAAACQVAGAAALSAAQLELLAAQVQTQ
ncbi:carbohydrate kinase [Paucibacter sp. B2R-40]|uniref:carbohydrate kinase family protein n=1 Tax=Paucibacter sp. B2R-40 TaxID=2893554 RepID=UPI0021E38E35|nr:carbohydrate kinase [Paucibacter sp. B2R-40]MCV2356009.1 carbohydrate kinase [Paucibacter sp. B2R-40]